MFVTSGSTFFGTKASYQASISSGRLTYFGIDSLSNEVGKVYEHHYNRLDLNGLLLDELNFFKLPDINSGPRYLSEKVKQQNLVKIFSPEYYPQLKDFLTLQNSYINWRYQYHETSYPLQFHCWSLNKIREVKDDLV